MDLKARRLYNAHREGLVGRLAEQERLDDARAEELVAAWEAEAERIGVGRDHDEFWPLGREWIASTRATAPGSRLYLRLPGTARHGSGMVSMAVGAQHLDPVCGASVDSTEALRAGLRASHGGTEYLFCGVGCHVSFQDNPRRLLGLDDTRPTLWPTSNDRQDRSSTGRRGSWTRSRRDR